VTSSSLELLTDTRAEIVNLLRRHGGSTAHGLAAQLKISAVAVRRHLEQLESLDIVSHVLEQGGRGRPGFRYQLTRRGDDLFPDTTSELACDLLEEVEEAFGAEAVTKLLAARADRLIERLRRDLDGLGFDDRVEALAKHFDAAGFVADVERIDEGSFVVAERNCPTRFIAERFPHLCAEELRVYQEVTGAFVARTCRMTEGGQCCEYRITSASSRSLPVLGSITSGGERG